MKALEVFSRIALFLVIFSGSAASGPGRDPTIIVGPYLQRAAPTRINIMWETSLPGKSWVEWGRTSYLGKRTDAYSNIGVGILSLRFAQPCPIRYNLSTSPSIRSPRQTG
jgi:hypothetical protein